MNRWYFWCKLKVKENIDQRCSRLWSKYLDPPNQRGTGARRVCGGRTLQSLSQRIPNHSRPKNVLHLYHRPHKKREKPPPTCNESSTQTQHNRENYCNKSLTGHQTSSQLHGWQTIYHPATHLQPKGQKRKENLFRSRKNLVNQPASYLPLTNVLKIRQEITQTL